MLGLYSPVMASTESMISDSAFPDFPAENPSKRELKEWLDVFKDALITAGFLSVRLMTSVTSDGRTP